MVYIKGKIMFAVYFQSLVNLPLFGNQILVFKTLGSFQLRFSHHPQWSPSRLFKHFYLIVFLGYFITAQCKHRTFLLQKARIQLLSLLTNIMAHRHALSLKDTVTNRHLSCQNLLVVNKKNLQKCRL